MFAAYRGGSVIVFAPLAAMAAVALTRPYLVLPFFSGIFMEQMVNFIKLYFPLFLLGAIFGKLIEVSGFAHSIIRAIVGVVGANHAMLAVVLACAILTYGGVSLFVVAFAVYPFGAEMFRLAGIPKRLLPATIALGAFTFSMDALPGSPQIQNLIPTSFFQTDSWAAPRLGLFGAVLIFGAGMLYLEWRRRRARRAGEGYGEGHHNEPKAPSEEKLPHPVVAILPLVLVGVLNKVFSVVLPALYGDRFDFAAAGVPRVASLEVHRVSAIWALEAALVAAILFVVVISFRRIRASMTTSLNAAVGGSMLAVLNTGSEYGFGSVIAALPGFTTVSQVLSATIRDPLLNIAVTTNALAGITGSASGGMSIVLASFGHSYLDRALAAGISPEVLHRVVAMASGGMDTLPHNGAIITLLTITGLTHRHAYRDIFAMTVIKTLAVGFVIGFYYLFRIY